MTCVYTVVLQLSLYFLFINVAITFSGNIICFTDYNMVARASSLMALNPDDYKSFYGPIKQPY